MAYQTINRIFHKNETDLTSSEAHGLATGMLCIENKMDASNWLTELFSDEITLLDEDKTVLVALFEQTRMLLNEEDDGFRYDLFLPGDDEALTEQVQAIRAWCEGFLFGIGHSRSEAAWPGETGEIMKDIVEFTKLDVDVDDDMDEEDINEHDSALIEIQEYLRVAVMMVRDQFREENNGQAVN
jgi:yecA family protein